MKNQDLNEVVFKNRNKDYGAYFLRKNYHRYLMISIIISIICCCSVVLYLYFQNVRMIYDYGTDRRSKFVELSAEHLDSPNEKSVTFQKTEMMTIFPMIVDDLPSGSIHNEEEEEKIYQPEGYNKSTDKGTLEFLPTFLGGDLKKFANWVMTQFKYPDDARRKKEKGTFIIFFVIEKNGSVTNIRVESNPGRSIDKEIKRVMTSSPNWSPGIASGKPVRVRLKLPMTLSIK